MDGSATHASFVRLHTKFVSAQQPATPQAAANVSRRSPGCLRWHPIAAFFPVHAVPSYTNKLFGRHGFFFFHAKLPSVHTTSRHLTPSDAEKHCEHVRVVIAEWLVAAPHVEDIDTPPRGRRARRTLCT